MKSKKINKKSKFKISKKHIVLALLLLLISSAYSLASGGYMSTIFGQQATINAISGKKSCLEGCVGGLYQYYNKKKGCLTKPSPKCGRGSTNTTIVSPPITPSNNQPGNCPNLPKNIEDGCGTVVPGYKDPCMPTELRILVRDKYDCTKFITKCEFSERCKTGTSTCVGQKIELGCGDTSCNPGEYTIQTVSGEKCDIRKIECIKDHEWCKNDGV